MLGIKSCFLMKGAGVSLPLLDVGVDIFVTNLMTNVHYRPSALSVNDDHQVDRHL